MSTATRIHNQPVTPANWLKQAFRDVLRLGGVSALLASLEEDVNHRNPEDRERVWELLLPVARAVVWEEYVRYGETLEVGFNFTIGTHKPFIWASVTTEGGAWADWHINPEHNTSYGWDREVRG
ncbi:hypothetical protein [Paenibacillus sp. IHBB 3054]|uniref:hypothetical protein n=1 Tax=Paenibacillus sp. IHBB 3054 TaxID=3425689 RepID=UPI003F6613DF